MNCEPREVRLRMSVLEPVYREIFALLERNFAALGKPLASCSLNGPAGSKRARGYLAALAKGLLAQASPRKPSDDEQLAAIAVGFTLVFQEDYDRVWERMLDTISEYELGDAEVLAGAGIAEQDLAMRGGGVHQAGMLGFSELLQGKLSA